MLESCTFFMICRKLREKGQPAQSILGRFHLTIPLNCVTAFLRLQYNALQLIPAKNTAAEHQDKPTPWLYHQAQNVRVQSTCSIPFAEWRGVRIT